MPAVPTQIRHARSAWNRALVFGLAGTGIGIGLLCAGCAVLIGRASGLSLEIPALLAGAVISLSWAIRRYRRSRVIDEQVATLLDLRHGGDGRLLFAIETGMPLSADWSKLTRPRPDLRRISRVLLPGTAFFIATLWVPLRLPAQVGTDPISTQRLEEIEGLATALEEVVELDPDLHQEVEENLAALTKGNQGEYPDGDVLREALDRMEARLDQAAEQAADRFGEIARAAEEAAAGASSEDPIERQAALDQLAEMARNFAEQAGPEGAPALDPAMLEQLAESGLDPSLLQKLAEMSDLSQLGQLAQGLDPEAAKRLAAAAAGTLSKAALEKLAEMARSGLLDGSDHPGQPGMSPSDASLEEMLARMEAQELIGGT